jgi:hypothetical protein
MPEFCTCGTQLVERAHFCHNCGRPTSGQPEPPVEIPRIVLAPPVLPRVEDAGVSFANPAVLRIAFAASALSILLDFTPFVGFLFIIWSMGAGFMAVWMYCKRIGRPLSITSGAKMGWITGVFTFTIMTVLLTSVAVLSGGKWSEEFHQQMTQQITTTWAHDPQYQQALRALENPTTFASVILFMMLVFFILLSLASVAGGALGARFSNKE